MGGKKAHNSNMGLDNLFEENKAIGREGNFKRNDTPYKIKVNTQTKDITLHDIGETEKGETALTPEIIREAQESTGILKTPDNWEDLDESITSQSRDLNDSSSSINWDYSDDMHYQTINDSLNTKGDYVSPTIKAISEGSLALDYSTDLHHQTINYSPVVLPRKCFVCQELILKSNWESHLYRHGFGGHPKKCIHCHERIPISEWVKHNCGIDNLHSEY